MTAKELMKQCEAEEKELKFREFSSETALAIGMALQKKRKNVTIKYVQILQQPEEDCFIIPVMVML